MVNNAHEARRLAKASDHPELQQVLADITYWAGQGKYSIDVQPMPEQLVNNLKSRGFSVFNEMTIAW